jgi:hypothetical protein
MKTEHSFGAGWVRDRNRARVLASIDQLADKGSPITSMLSWTGPWPGKWSFVDIDWLTNRIVDLEQNVFVMGSTGRVSVRFPPDRNATPRQAFNEEIDPIEGVNRSGDFMDLRPLGKHLYACGMARQVYRREGEQKWARADQGTVLPPGSMEVVGFTSMDGVSEDDFYAVGFEGEIWRCLRGAWSQMDSVTNVVLQCVRVVAPDRVYACGQNGVLLRGTANRWRVLDTSPVEEEELWSIQAFKGDVYLASTSAIYKLDKNDVPRKVDTKLGKDLTHLHLHAADGFMWSFGVKDVMLTEDGKTWRDATPGTKQYTP